MTCLALQGRSCHTYGSYKHVHAFLLKDIIRTRLERVHGEAKKCTLKTQKKYVSVTRN